MIQWKQRLYAFLLRRVLGPLLDASDAHKLHDSIEFSLQEGKFILKDIQLNAEYLSERLASSGSARLSIQKATVQRLEICLSLRENAASPSSSDDNNIATQSSFAWRAMKLGGGTSAESSLPAVSLLAEIHVHGVDLELVPLAAADPGQQQQQQTPNQQSPTTDQEVSGDNPRTMIGSYVDAALASLLMTLKLSNINVKMCHKETWVEVKLSSLTYKDLELQPASTTTVYKTVLNKSLELSDITIHAGEEGADVHNSRSTVLAMAKGSGRVFIRVMDYSSVASSKQKSKSKSARNISQDIEVSLNHQLNFSLDRSSLRYLQTVADGLAQSTADNDANEPESQSSSTQMMSMAGVHNNSSSSRLKNPLFEDDDETDREDLKAITGIMKQYREAYHLAENNQLRGGILVPSHAYIDDADALEEDDAMTFDVFFDANDQSFYNAASTLKESVLLLDESDDDNGGNGDSIQTKVRLHLLSGCMKINFRDLSQRQQQQYAVPQEYILLSLDDLNVSLSSNRRRSELTCSVAHFEIEDAQLDSTSRKSKGPGTIDIGSLLSFASTDAEEYENEAVVSQAPCITLHVQFSKEHKNKKSIDCNLTLLPIEVVIRQRSLANLAKFVAETGKTETASSSQRVTPKESSSDDTQISFACSCPSLTLSIPLLKWLSTAPLFNRCGETLHDYHVRHAFLGLTLDTIDLQWNKGDSETSQRGLESCAKFSFFRMLMFACAPVGDKVSVGAKMQRTDFVLLNGRTEVNPYIPITLEYLKIDPSSKDAGSIGRETFPIVPAISSFKARQEDEDEELKIDRLLFSKLHDVDVDVDADSRKNLRGTDPQIAMVTDSEKSNAIVSLNIPEIIVDLTKTELTTVLAMVDLAQPSTEESPTPEAEKSKDKSTSTPHTLSIVLNVDQISVSLKEDFRIEDLYGDRSKKDRFSCLFAVNKFRTHFLLNGSDLRHLRVLAHDMGLYSALHPRIDAEVRRAERDVLQRLTAMKQRIRIYKDASVSPILYRSQMFTPICQDAPSFMLDIRDTTSISSNGMAEGFTQRQVYLTLYHLTFRYDVDSDWIERLKSLLPQNSSSASDTSSDNSFKHIGSPSMTRLFVSVADCNMDYSSPKYFEMESRSIVRLGDFRFSSNIMAPVSRNQAYSASLGDLSYHLSNQRMPHLNEDMKLCRASIIMPTNYSRTKNSKNPSSHGTTAEGLLREMNFVEVLGLASMDAVVAITKWDSPGRTRQPSIDPGTTTSLTFGLLSIGACKDSFNCFATTVGEVQAKLTALTDEDVSRLRREGDAKACTNKPLQNVVKSQLPPQVVSTSAQEHGQSEAFLLDGYDWMDIDHDPLRELEIPDGDEQISGWYKESTKSHESPKAAGIEAGQSQRIPGKIVRHHFPFHSISNPMADGDMSVSNYAGEGSVLTLKSRVLVHKLTVKMRLYDGYDWPETLTDRQKKFLKKTGKFVIEPIPRSEVAKAREAIDKELFERLEHEYGEEAASTKRKVAIMADLLATDEKKEEKSPFQNAPLPEDRAKTIEQETETRRLSRRSKIYLQLSANGVTARVDAYEESSTHRLASVLGLSISDMFIAETASLSHPVKMLGEWVNENEHPRDTRFGTFMLKMITWKPVHPVTPENEIESDDCEATIQLLPMRAIIDQRAIQFVRAFFHNEDSGDDEKKEKWTAGLHLIPPPRFRTFGVKPWKLKVDYNPQKLDVGALRDGSIVELINISPIDGMVITLSQDSVEGVVGFGDVMGGLTSIWLQEIVATQLHKFLANARPFEPITDVGQGMTDLVVLPYEAFKNGEDVRRAMGKGVMSLAETVTFQALTTTSRLTEYAANKMSTIVGGRYHSSARNPLPARPTSAPKGVQDVTGHAMESIYRGIQAANHKIVIIPFREYERHGATSAATSVLRGIPVMLVAPVTGATEALSYTLLGARNALRPDIRREEEASRTGFTSYE